MRSLPVQYSLLQEVVTSLYFSPRKVFCPLYFSLHEIVTCPIFLTAGGRYQFIFLTAEGCLSSIFLTAWDRSLSNILHCRRSLPVYISHRGRLSVLYISHCSRSLPVQYSSLQEALPVLIFLNAGILSSIFLTAGGRYLCSSVQKVFCPLYFSLQEDVTCPIFLTIAGLLSSIFLTTGGRNLSNIPQCRRWISGLYSLICQFATRLYP
jgi:hypothetical protein